MKGFESVAKLSVIEARDLLEGPQLISLKLCIVPVQICGLICPSQEGIHHHHEEVCPEQDCGEEAMVCDRLLSTWLYWKDVQIRGAAVACQFLPHVLQR